MDSAQGKSKRSGRARDEAKARAIAAAEAEQAAQGGGAVPGEQGEQGEAGPGDEDDADKDGDEDGKPDLELLRKRIPQAMKSLLTILKKAKAGETQRVIKKVRFLRGKVGAQEGGDGKEAELREMEGQLDALKKIDLHTILAPLLFQKIKKHPFIRPLLPLPDDLFPEVSAGTMAGEVTSAEGKARNRLVSSKGTGEAVAGVVGWCVGVQGGKLKTSTKAKVAPKGKESTTRAGNDREKLQGTVQSRNAKGQENQSTADVAVAVRRTDDDGGIEDDDIAAQNAAADAAGWESGDVDDGGDAFDDDDAMSDGESDGGSDVIRDEDYASDLDSGPAAKKRRTAVSPSPPPAGLTTGKHKAGSSMFLPTLASGFTMGDYDSDPDEDERRDKKSGKGGLVQSVRKNRRGQAERRKIWEKKYGSGANHVKKQAEEGARVEKDRAFLASQMGETAGRGAKWGAKGGPTTKRAGAANVRDSGWGARPTATTTRTTTAPSTAPVKTQKDPPKPATTKTGTEHPSWAAARMRKEKEMAGGAAVGKPKKIVFD